MFTALHALAKQATLMITIAAEGDDQLRVNVTPMPSDDKVKAQLPNPLSLLASPAEFDADFIAALATWQAPKRSLLEQAQDATEAQDPAAPAAPALKTPAKKDKAAGKAAARGGKPTAPEPAPETAKGASEPAQSATEPVESATEPAKSATEPAEVETAVAPSPVQAVPEQQPADTLTLNLF